MLRPAEKKDLPGILTIYNDAILHTTAIYDYTPHTLAERTAWFDAHQKAGYPIFVDDADGHIRGFAAYGSFRDWPAYKYTIEHSIYVHPAERRRGIARKLMEKLLATADAEGYATMVAGIDSANEGSIHLHEQLGFKKVGRIEKAGFKFGHWLDLVFYQRLLQGPARPADGSPARR